MSVNPHARYTRVVGGNIMGSPTPPECAATPGRSRRTRNGAAPRTAARLRSRRAWRSMRQPMAVVPMVRRRQRRDAGLDRTRQRRLFIWFDLDCREARHGRPRHLLTPCIDEAGADPMPICHSLCRRARHQGLANDGQLGRRTPPPPTLQPGTDLDPLRQPILTTVVRLVVRALVHVHHAPPHPTRHVFCSNQDQAGMWG